jgi:hypothetical protein
MNDGIKTPGAHFNSQCSPFIIQLSLSAFTFSVHLSSVTGYRSSFIGQRPSLLLP